MTDTTVDPRNKITRFARAFPVADLIDHPQNPHVSDDEAIAQSVNVNGFTNVVVVQESTGFIVAGHGRKRAAIAEGMTHVPVVWADLNELEARRMLAYDNRASQLGHDDNDLLAELLGGFSDDELLGTLFTPDEREVLLSVVSGPSSLDDLERRYGDPEDHHLWPVLKFKVSPEDRARWDALTADCGNDTNAQFRKALDLAEATQAVESVAD